MFMLHPFPTVLHIPLVVHVSSQSGHRLALPNARLQILPRISQCPRLRRRQILIVQILFSWCHHIKAGAATIMAAIKQHQNKSLSQLPFSACCSALKSLKSAFCLYLSIVHLFQLFSQYPKPWRINCSHVALMHWVSVPRAEHAPYTPCIPCPIIANVIATLRWVFFHVIHFYHCLPFQCVIRINLRLAMSNPVSAESWRNVTFGWLS